MESTQDKIVALIGAIPVTIAYVGPRTDANKWDHDEWAVSLGDYRTTYKTGLGHRKWDKPYSARKVLPHGAKSYRYTSQELGNPRSIHYAQMASANLKPCMPHAGDIVASLARDGEAINQSFVDWCDEYGFNADSIRDRAVYDECCDIGARLRATFSRATLEAILELAAEL